MLEVSQHCSPLPEHIPSFVHVGAWRDEHQRRRPPFPTCHWAGGKHKPGTLVMQMNKFLLTKAPLNVMMSNGCSRSAHSSDLKCLAGAESTGYLCHYCCHSSLFNFTFTWHPKLRRLSPHDRAPFLFPSLLCALFFLSEKQHLAVFLWKANVPGSSDKREGQK